MSQWGRLDQVVADLRDGRSGRLSIGYFSSAGAAWMPSLVKRLTAEFPDLVLELVLNEVEQKVPRLDIDLVIDPPDGPVPSGYTRTELTEDQFVAIVPRGHPLAEAGTIALADLRGETWVSNDYPRALRTPPRRRRVQRRRLPAAVQRAGPGPLHGDRLRRRGHRRLGAAGPRGAQPAGDGGAARARGADPGAPPGRRRARPRCAEPARRAGGGPAQGAHRPPERRVAAAGRSPVRTSRARRPRRWPGKARCPPCGSVRRGPAWSASPTPPRARRPRPARRRMPWARRPARRTPGARRA